MTDAQLSQLMKESAERSKKLQPYYEYFRKSHRRFLKPFNLTPRSELYDSVPVSQLQTLSDVNHFVLNPVDTLVDMIRRKECHVAYVNEGLIATYPTKDLVKRYHKEYKKIVPSELVDLKFSDVLNNTDDEKISDFSYLSDANEKVSPAIRICFLCHDETEQQEILKKLIDLFSPYGYFYQTTESIAAHGLLLSYVQFEAQYTDMLVDMSDVLYHVSPMKNLRKIAKNGLVPHPVKATGQHHLKQDAPQFSYSPCVFMFNKCPQNVVYAYGCHVADKASDVGFCVFKVDKKKLTADPIFADGKQKFYLDPAFSLSNVMTDQTAIYTYSNIPLRVLDDQVLLVKTDNSQITSSEVKSLKSLSTKA